MHKVFRYYTESEKSEIIANKACHVSRVMHPIISQSLFGQHSAKILKRLLLLYKPCDLVYKFKVSSIQVNEVAIHLNNFIL